MISKTILAVGAHPDDIEINCSGTLKLLRALGWEIHVATMTLGDCGSRELTPEATAKRRRQEAEEACRLLEASYHYAGSSDFCIFNDDQHNRRVTELLRQSAPRIVFTHPPADYLTDHETTSTLVRNACFYASVSNYSTSGARPIAEVPYLYYYDSIGGVDILGRRIMPEFYVDVTDVMDFRLQMLAKHASQREWLRSQHGVEDYLMSMQNWAAERGGEASTIAGAAVTHAEAFRQHRGHAYAADNLLKAVLGTRVISNPKYSDRTV
jgi:N-acetylglucosamine malate deacetylase 1